MVLQKKKRSSKLFKHYLKKVFFLFFIFILFIFSFSIHTVQAKESVGELDYVENSMIALNYHRVRRMGRLEKVFDLFSNNKELSVYSVSADEFERQIKWLVEQDANFLTFNEFIHYLEKGEFPKRSVWINFDDMDRTIYENAHPVLEKYQVPATGFVISGQVGSKDFNNLRMLNEEELLDMHESGLWNFQSHTYDLHYLNEDKSALVSADYHEVFADLQQSKQVIENLFRTTNKALAYPYGSGNETVNKAMQANGIEYGFTLEEKIVTPETNKQYIPRILISEDSFKQLIETWKGFD